MNFLNTAFQNNSFMLSNINAAQSSRNTDYAQTEQNLHTAPTPVPASTSSKEASGDFYALKRDQNNPLSAAFKTSATDATADAQRQADKYALKTTASTSAEVNTVLQRFATEGKPVAVVSGGSLSGYTVALQLKNHGFNVLVAEARDTYTRHNILALKEEAIYTLAKLAPDGKLINELLESSRLSLRKSRIDEKNGQLVQLPTPTYRFADWLLPASKRKGLPPRIPVRTHTTQQTSASLNVEQTGTASAHKQKPLEHLNLEWPQNDVVDSVKQEDWHYDDLNRVSDVTLAIGQIRDLEAGLNRYWVNSAGIEVIHAKVDLQETGEGYTTDLKLNDGSVTPDFPLDLVCLAEGKGSNIARFSEQKIIETNEAWYQRSFRVERGLKSGSSLIANPKYPEKPPLVPIRIQRENDSAINIAYYANRQETAEQIWTRMSDRTQAVLQAAGSNARADNPDIIEYQSKRIDVDWRRSSVMARANVVLVGDAAGTSSPIAGAGGSLAMSAYPEIVERLAKHPGFRDPQRREEANAMYNEQAAQSLDVWLHKSADVMRKLKLFSSEKLREINASSGRVASLKKTREAAARQAQT